ncbi:hypothetical protein [Nitrobacter sp.]|uniref:hypothetical protein n=1 Tax=Nitrobacter sp. TaxID=29420 RepID=UPI001DE5E55A|nr:hypothetical protein [Nitrobacter sp.]MCB1393708.1 hypothetical protein [Nitrobacter sp.]
MTISALGQGYSEARYTTTASSSTQARGPQLLFGPAARLGDRFKLEEDGAIGEVVTRNHVAQPCEAGGLFGLCKAFTIQAIA